MFHLIAIVLIVFMSLFSNPIYAQPYGPKLCKEDPLYHCYKTKKGDTWEKLFPDEEQKNMVMKINRVNLRLHSGMIIAIPNTILNTTLLDYAPFKKDIDPPGEKIILVSLNNLAWGAYDEKGTLVNWGPVSGGKGYCPDIGRGCHTSKGTFHIYTKQGSGCKSTKFPVGRGGAPMPYCMFFHGGFALHGSYDVPGYNASHGCVRLMVNDAKWLNQEFVRDEEVKVIVQ